MTTWIILGFDTFDHDVIALVDTNVFGTESEPITKDRLVPERAKRYNSTKEAAPDLMFLFRQDERAFPPFNPMLGIETDGHVESIVVRPGVLSEAKQGIDPILEPYGIPVIEHAEA